jgi:hypothetical protein
MQAGYQGDSDEVHGMRSTEATSSEQRACRAYPGSRSVRLMSPRSTTHASAGNKPCCTDRGDSHDGMQSCASSLGRFDVAGLTLFHSNHLVPETGRARHFFGLGCDFPIDVAAHLALRRVALKAQVPSP